MESHLMIQLKLVITKVLQKQRTPLTKFVPQKNAQKTPELYVASLKCSACDRSVHYRCTGLPHYMIEFFTKKYGGNNASGTVDCIVVPKEVKEATGHCENHINTIFHLRRDVSACESLVKAQRETINKQSSEILSIRS